MAFSEAELETMLCSKNVYDRMRAAMAGYGLDVLIYDAHHRVRAEVARQGYGLDVLIRDNSMHVRAAVAEQGYRLDLLVKDKTPYVRHIVAGQRYGLEQLACDPEPYVAIYAKWILNEIHKEEQKMQHSLDISQIAYELYKQDWVQQHTNPEIRNKAVEDYEEFVQECKEDGEEAPSFEEYLEEYGYDGALYVCYDEFCDMEYHDVGYIKSLLGEDEGLLKRYFDDVDAAYEEPEALAVVADVVSAAELRCLSDIAQDSRQTEYILD